jgi:DHA2 family lincomycin resistance protein-like MFS transporter
MNGPDMAQLARSTESAQAQGATGAPAATAARNRLVISLLLASSFVVILNETIMSVALPRLMEDLSISAGTAQWLTTAFMLTMAIVIPITGYLLQRFSTRTVFIAAMSLFSIGTLVAAVAPGFPVLVTARVIQAMGTAIMVPLLFTTVLTIVPEKSRGRVMGNISIVIAVAPAIGPTISGLILSVLDWRWMFIIVLPIALIALALGARRIPNITEPVTTPLDVLSVVLTAFGFGGLVFGLSNIGTVEGGLANVAAWLPLAVGIVGLVLFVLRQRHLQRTDSALLDLRTFSTRTFTLAIIMVSVSMVALFGTITLIPLYTANVLGVDTLTTGLLLLPGGLVMGLLAPFIGRIYDAMGPRALVITGSAIVSLSLWGMTFLGVDTTIWWVLVAHVSLSIGLALLFTPLFTAGLGSLSPALYSHGSAVVGTIQQVAGAAGVALFITVMSSRASAELTSGADAVVAQAAGIHTALVIGAIISLVAVPLSFFIRKPADAPDGAPIHH